jgi:hypothetical protein
MRMPTLPHALHPVPALWALLLFCCQPAGPLAADESPDAAGGSVVQAPPEGRRLREGRWQVAVEAPLGVPDDRGIIPSRDRRPIVTRPVPHLEAWAWSPAEDLWWSLGAVDAQGALQTDRMTEDAHLVLVARSEGDRPLAIVDCPGLRCAKTRTWAVSWQAPPDGALTVAWDDEASGPLYTWWTVHQSMDWVDGWVGAQPWEPLQIHWQPGEEPACGTSCYEARDGHRILLLSGPDDTDEFDTDIIRHEFAHYLQASRQRLRGAGGYHDGSPTRPALAWSEGFCTAFAMLAADAVEYVDTDAWGGAWIDHGTPAARWPEDAMRLGDPHSEELVAGVLLALWRANPTWAQALAHRFLQDQEEPDDVPDSLRALLRWLRCASGIPEAGWAPVLAPFGLDDDVLAALSCEAVRGLDEAHDAGASPSPITPVVPRWVDSRASAVEVRVRTTVDSFVGTLWREDSGTPVHTWTWETGRRGDMLREVIPEPALPGSGGPRDAYRVDVHMPGGVVYIASAERPAWRTPPMPSREAVLVDGPGGRPLRLSQVPSPGLPGEEAP